MLKKQLSEITGLKWFKSKSEKNEVYFSKTFYT